MEKNTVFILLLVLALLGAGLIGFLIFGKPPAEVAPNPYQMTLEVYDVGEAAQDWREALNRTFFLEENARLGRVELMPNGQLGILTFPETHRSIKAFVKGKSLTPYQKNIQYEGLALMVAPSEPNQIPENLQADVKSLLKDVQGSISVVERTFVSQSSGGESQSEGTHFKWSFRGNLSGDVIGLEFQLRQGAHLDSNLFLQTGKPILVGSVGTRIFNRNPRGQNGDDYILIILKATVSN